MQTLTQITLLQVKDGYINLYNEELDYNNSLFENKSNPIDLELVKKVFKECFKSLKTESSYEFNSTLGDSLPGTLRHRAKELAIVYFNFKKLIEEADQADHFIPSGDGRLDQLFVVYSNYLKNKILISALFEETNEMRQEWNKLMLEKQFSGKFTEWRTHFSVVDLMISQINFQMTRIKDSVPRRPLISVKKTPWKFITPQIKREENVKSDECSYDFNDNSFTDDYLNVVNLFGNVKLS